MIYAQMDSFLHWSRSQLTHWGRVMHICVSKLTIIGSDNGLAPVRRQAIIWTNAGILYIGPKGTNFSEILIEILTFSFKKLRLKVSSAKRRPFCLGLNVLTQLQQGLHWKQDSSWSDNLSTGRNDLVSLELLFIEYLTCTFLCYVATPSSEPWRTGADK